MQIENDYDKEVYNGDIGYVDDVDPDAGELTASFDGRSVTYGFGELDTLVPAYAATIHKSQGSEYPAVVIPVMTQHYTMLQRNLLYTGPSVPMIMRHLSPKSLASGRRTEIIWLCRTETRSRMVPPWQPQRRQLPNYRTGRADGRSPGRTS
jgi:hypothetical protein